MKQGTKTVSRRKIVHWAAVLAVCVTSAVFLARWWTVRSEERFEASLRTASLAELQQFAQKRDWDPIVFYWLGTRLTFEGRHPEAIQALARSVALNPNSAEAHAALGVALGRADRFRDAESQLKQALALAPHNAFTHFALGGLYVKHKVWEPAAEHLKTAIAHDPNNLEAQYLLAICYGELFQEERKREVLERLLQRAPDDIRFMKEMGYVLLFYGKFAEAEALYRRILAQAPDDQETHYLLGRALAEQASTPEAFAVAERELKGVAAQVRDEPGVYLALGILYFRRNEPEKAVPELERAIRMDVRELKTWLYLGQAYMRIGRTAAGKKTLAEFERASRVKRTASHLENRLLNLPESTPEQIREKNDVRLRLARVYMEDSRYARALNHLRMIQERGGAGPEVQKLALACQQQVRKTPASN